MLNDAGYIALIIIMVFWAVLFGLGLVVGYRPGRKKHKPQRKPTQSHG